jgi:general transcription factor 3C polypeptide 5 (transcription factor C subunit 1)
MNSSSDETPYRDSSPEDVQDENDQEPIAGPAPPDMAPKYTVPNRILGAVEIPAVVNDVDRAVQAFGRVSSLQHVRLL